MWSGLLVSSLAVFTFFTLAVHSFDVTVGTPTQCDDLNVSWTGGVAPFQITLTPIFANPLNFSVPSSAFNDNRGAYSIAQLPFVEGQTFLLTMSDATGFGTGGTTGILTTGASTSGDQCDTTNATVSFDFELNSALVECGFYTFTYPNAVQPVFITGLIPLGDSFFLYPPVGSDTFEWVADVASGTDIVFCMTDSQGRSGGASPIENVDLSNNSTCLSPTSPSSTASASASTSFSSTTTSPSVTTTSPLSTSVIVYSASNDSISIGAIVGAVVGSVIAIAVLVVLAFFIFRRRRRHQKNTASDVMRQLDPELSTNFGSGGNSYFATHPSTVQPLLYSTNSVDRPSPPVSQTDLPFQSNALGSSSDIQMYPISRPTSYGDSVGRSTGTGNSGLSDRVRGKAAMAGQPMNRASPRIILHTDIEEVEQGQSGVVELPPQYSERRRPMPPIPSSAGISGENLFQSKSTDPASGAR